MDNAELSKEKKDKDIFNSFTKQLRDDKKLLKFYSQNIQSFINLNIEHKKSLMKIINDIDKYSSEEHQTFNFLKDFQIILNLEHNFINNFLEKNESVFENLKKALDSNILIIRRFLSSMENIEENMKIKSEFMHGQNNYIVKCFQSMENAITEEYFINKYKFKLNKDKDKGKEQNTSKEKLIDECHKIEKDFSFLSKEVDSLIKKYVEKYNTEIIEIKNKMIDLYKSAKDGILNIIKNIKEIHNNSIISAETSFQNLDKYNMDNKELISELELYLNNPIKEEEFSYLLQNKKYQFHILNKNEARLCKLFDYKVNKDNLNLLINCKDIYNIMEEIYKYNFELIDKTNYNLGIEKVKLDIIEKIGKLFGYDFFLFTKTKIEIFSEKELNNFIDIIFSNEEYIILFLSYLNNYRTKGKFNIDEEQFKILKIILCKISDYLIDHNNRNIYHPLIILSQTFYIIVDGKNYYLQSEIKNKEFFTKKEFWTDFLGNKINEELNQFDKQTNDPNIKKDLNKDKKDEIILNKIISLIPSFTCFDLSKESINDILLFLINKFNIIDEEKKKMIFSFVDIEK